MKSLVVFYSHTGNTKLVAQTIADALKADLVEIEEVKPRGKGATTIMTGGFGAITNNSSEIKPVNIDFAQYDTIFLGAPVWASRPVPAINAFLKASNFAGRNVVLFFTRGSNSAGKAPEKTTSKIERSNGKVTGSFEVKSAQVTEDEMVTAAKEAVKDYIK
jgi:flavodoxin